VHSSSWETHRRATERYLPHGITVLHATQHTHLNPSQAGQYTIYHQPWRVGRLSWPWWW